MLIAERAQALTIPKESAVMENFLATNATKLRYLAKENMFPREEAQREVVGGL
jgi:hypothetical protein